VTISKLQQPKKLMIFFKFRSIGKTMYICKICGSNPYKKEKITLFLPL